MSRKKAFIAPIGLRIKAFIIDLFLIAMPLLYFTTYIIIGSSDELSTHQLAISVVWGVYGLVTTLFFTIKAQTPGYRSSQIYLVSLKTGKKAKFITIFIRYLAFIIAGFSIIGLLLCFFRKDRLNLHDLLTQTAPVKAKTTP